MWPSPCFAGRFNWGDWHSMPFARQDPSLPQSLSNIVLYLRIGARKALSPQNEGPQIPLSSRHSFDEMSWPEVRAPRLSCVLGHRKIHLTCPDLLDILFLDFFSNVMERQSSVNMCHFLLRRPGEWWDGGTSTKQEQKGTQCKPVQATKPVGELRKYSTGPLKSLTCEG